MSIMDIIWPWGRIKQLDQERAVRAAEKTYFLSELERREQQAEEERERADRLSNKVIKLADENLRLRRLMENSHYRDPETGRIGKQGEYPL